MKKCYSPLLVFIFIMSYFSFCILKFLFVTFNQKWYLKYKTMSKIHIWKKFSGSCFFLFLRLIPHYSSNHPSSPLLIASHHSQFTLRNNDWSSIQQHIQWKEFQREIWCKMFQMHLISSIFIFLKSKLVHYIHNNVLHISWKFYLEIFHT